MKKLLSFIGILLCIGLLWGCFAPAQPDSTQAPTVASTQEATSAPTQPEATTQAPTVETTQAPTEETTAPAPAHSELYIPGLDVEDVITYFNEVCLDAEFSDGGDFTLLQKWTEPIVYTIKGDPTEEDLAALNNFTVWLNNYPGFPGIYEGPNPDYANLHLNFCSSEDMVDILGDNFYGMDGGVTFWYDGDNRIYHAVICYRNDIDQYLRNSVILEEIYNGLGPVQDTQLREDSIIYAEFSEPQALTQIDELILKLLYHPDMKCGMNAAACEAVIRQLYY